MAKKYWWEEDENTTQTKAEQQPQNQAKKTYWWEPESVAATIGNDVSSRVNAWVERNNAYLSNYNKRFSGRKNSYDDAYVSDSANWLESVRVQGNRLNQDAQSILDYVDQYKEYLDADWVDSVKSTLNSSRMQYYDLLSGAKNDNKYWSQWETEDDYKKEVAAAKDYEAKSTADLGAVEKEIEHLSQVADEFATVSNQYFAVENNPDLFTQEDRDDITAKYNILVNNYGTPEDFTAALNEKKRFMASAKRIQEGITLSGVVNNDDFDTNSGYVSTKYGNKLAKLGSRYGLGYEDLTYEYINGAENGMRDEIINTGTGWHKNRDVMDEMFGAYDQMTEDEIAIYNYYYSKEGKKAAEKYLDNIQESLNARAASDKFSKMEDKTLLELAFGVSAGIDQFASGMKSLFNTEDEYITPSVTQMLSGMVREDLADAGPNLPEWMGGASLGQMGYDTITTTANMAPSILTSVAVGMVNPVAGQWVGSGLMGGSAAGSAYQEALNNGYSKGQARGYSTLVGVSEVVMEKVLGGISAFGGNALGKYFTANISNADTALKMIAKRIGASALSEFTEEYLQEVLTPVFSNMMLGTNDDVKLFSAEALYSGILGALTAGVMEGPSTIHSEVSTYKTGKNLQAKDVSAQRLADIGKTFAADTVAYQLADKVNENTNAYTMGRLFNEIGATLSEQNVTEITEALVAKGMNESVARKNAEALAYVVEGGQLSDTQIAIIEANDVLAEVARTTLIDANTTWNQRAKGYNDMLKALADEVASPKKAKAKQARQPQENAPIADSVDGQTGIATESHTEAEIIDTSPAKVTSISDISKKTIKLEDGSEVNVKDADLSPDDGVRIETIASIDGISTEDANFVLNTLRANTGASAQMDSLGAKEAYKYGFYGFSQDHIAKHGVFANSLTESQRQAIYETGRKARQKQIDNAAPTAKTKQRGIYFDQGGGKVVSFKDADKSALTEGKRKAGVQAALILNKLGIGGDIYFFESYRNASGKLVYKDENGIEKKAPNGWYSETDGSIHIDLNAGVKGDGLVLFTLAHELTHFIEKWSPKKYKILADFLIENYEKGQSMDKLVRAKQAHLSETRKKKVSYDEAYSEVIADSMEAMLADGNVIEKILELKAKDEGLVAKIKQFFDNLLVKIRNAYEGLTPDSSEGQAVLEMTDSIEKIQQLFAEALVEASDNFQTEQAKENTTEDGGVDGDYDIKLSPRMEEAFKPFAKEINSVVNQSISGKGNIDGKALMKDIMPTGPKITAMVAASSGDAIDISQKSIALSSSDIWHEYKRHTQAKPEVSRGQVAFTKRQFQNAVKCIISPDMVETVFTNTNNPTQRQSFAYAKKTSRGNYVVVEAVGGKKNPRIYPVMILQFSKAKWDKMMAQGKTLGEVLYDGDDAMLQALDIQQNKKSRVTAAQFASYEAIANTLRSPQLDTKVSQLDPIVNSESIEAMDVEVDTNTESVSPTVLKSERTWTESDYVQEREQAAKEISKAIGVSVKKAKAYIDSVNSIAKMIAEDRVRLDYFSSPGRSSFVGNVEYGGSFDFSTLCKKRRLLTGTFTAIQKALPNTALTADEILKIRNRMKDAGLEVSCGLCYVEGSRANMGQFAKEFLKLYKQYYPDAWQPNMADVNTPDGIEWVRINHPECYEQYEYFWNHYGTLKPGDKNLFASQQKPKLYQLHTEYKGEVLEKFNNDDNVEAKNLNGGIRLQSFSDFEIVHLIDTMQIIMDMSRVGLAGQAYTKVPDFAWALGDTGLKINLSLIAKGVDENGKLIFDDVEGMPIAEAMKLRDRYSKNVGTILVAFNDEQLLAAMADDRVDFIIPFHRSQWKKSQYEAMGLPAKTKDYTYMQNEKFIKPQYHEYRGRMVQDKATNYMPNEYWDFSKSGKENAEAYLEMCARNNKRPKFYKLLQNNGDGSYSLKADGSTDGYWKLLIDFKMYDNDGNGSPQMPVKPEFNMDEAQRMLNDYQGGHSNFPVAQGIVDEFVEEYKDNHKGALYPKAKTRAFTIIGNGIPTQLTKTVMGGVLDSAYEQTHDGQALYSDRDSDGNRLSAEQQEFFKDSKVRDADGNLLVGYHGTDADFDTFDADYISRDNKLGAGFYFKIGEGLQYSYKHPKTVYLNIVNPITDSSKTLSKKAITEFCKKTGIKIDYDADETDIGLYERLSYLYEGNTKDFLSNVVSILGIDGVISEERKTAVAFLPNQVKDIANTSPTTDPDIRYQDRADESVSNRSLLANAFEGLAQNDIEKNKIQEYKGKIDLINAEEKKLSELNAKIKELSFAKGPRDAKAIRDLQFEARQTANRINTYDKQLLRLEASKPLQNVLSREKKRAYQKAEQRGKEALDAYKEKVAETQRELLEKWKGNRKAAVAKARETAEKRNAREKLQKLVLDTTKWLTYPAKTDVKCPDILKKPYSDFLNGIDLSSKRLANGGDPTKNDLRLSNAMDSLATALDKIMTAQDPTQDTDKVLDTGYLDLPADFVMKLRDMNESIKSMMVEGDYVVNSMTAAEVRQLSQMIRTLNHAIKTMSNLYANLRFANVEALGFDTMEFMDALGEIEKTGGMKDFVQWDNALPYYAFKRFGKGGESVFEGLMDAQDKLAFLAKVIFDFQEKAWTGKEAKEWSEDTHTITLPNGNELTLTTADAMSIYCLSRREQGLQHLLGGGTRVLGIQEGSKKAKDSRSLLTIQDIDAINSSLTDRQKQVAEAIQEFMSTVCSEWGNEISMKRFLTKEFTEKFYFPIESNDENLPLKDPAAQQSDLFRLLNISATKPLTPGANNEVIIRNIFDVFTGHASDMARLNAYGMGLLDYMKWLNYREKAVTDEGQVKVRGVRKSMQLAYGDAAMGYVLNLVKDVNGRASDGGDPNILMKWMRAAKTASVGSSLRVATLQITSYPRAALVLSQKSLALGLTKKPNIEKAKKYCGIALWKSFGFYDTNISRSIEDQMKGVTDVKQKLIELSLKGAEIGDAITWGALWNACEYEVAKTTKNKVGSEEFYQEVGKKLREVVYRTQVVDSTLTRSQIMRSKRGMAQEAAAFMSEPTLSANILMDAGFEFGMEKRRTGSAKTAWKKTGTYIGRAVAIYSISQLAAALLESLWDAWRDDDDEEFYKKYLEAFGENLALDLVPFNKIPIVSDIFEGALSLIGVGYYSSDKMSSTWLTQAVSAVDTWKDVFSGKSSATVYNALYKTVRALSSYVGVSFSGAMREVVALWNNTAGAYDSTLKIRTWGLSKTDLGTELYDAIVSGNTRQADSLKAQFEDEKAIFSAMRTAIKDHYEAVDIDYETAKQYLVKFGGLEEDDAYWKVEEWKYEAESGEDFKKYNDFYEAVQTGKNLKVVIQKYTDNGVDKKTLASQITSYFKPLYKEMSKTERAAIKGYLLNAYSLLGYNRNEKSQDIDKWLKD